MGRRSSAAVAAAALSPKIREQQQPQQHHDQERIDDEPTKNFPTPSLSKRTSRRVQSDVPPSPTAQTPGRKKKATRAAREEGEKEKNNGVRQVVGSKEYAAKEQPRTGDNAETEPVGNGEDEADAEVEAEENDSEDEDEEEDSEEEGGGPEPLGDGFYEVEAVRKKRVRKGKLQYYIKWRGWPESANTWEPYDNVKDCDDIIEDFEKSHMARNGRRGRGKRRFGKYLLPQKKKRTSASNLEEGLTATDTGEDTEGAISTEQNGKNPSGVISEGPIVSVDCAATYSSESGMISSGSKTVGLKKHMATAAASQVVPEVVSTAEKFESECNNSSVRLSGRNDLERSHDKLMVSDGEALLKDVMVDTITSVHDPVIGPSASAKIPQDMKSTSSLSKLSEEILGEGSMANGHCQVKKETMFTDIGQRELLQNVTGNTLVAETKTLRKEGSNKRVPDEDPGKLAINDKCTGAKKRKQGFVRHVRQGLDAKEHDKKQMGTEEKIADIEQVLEDIFVANGGDSGAHEGKVPPNATSRQNQQGVDSQSCNTLAIIEIIKAVTYSSSTTNGKQDVCVLFKAVRADGQEVMVDNKFLRANHPLLLIDFYEQHLRYSTAQ